MCNKKTLELQQLLELFFSEEHTIKVLNTISDCNISGFEGWLQIEFAHFLEQQFKAGKYQQGWDREHRIEAEANEKKHIAPDFWFGIDKQNSAYDLVEFKQAKSIEKLKTAMEDDFCKYKELSSDVICSSDQKSYAIRNVYFVGVLSQKETDKAANLNSSGKLTLTKLNSSNKFKVFIDCHPIASIKN